MMSARFFNLDYDYHHSLSLEEKDESPFWFQWDYFVVKPTRRGRGAAMEEIDYPIEYDPMNLMGSILGQTIRFYAEQPEARAQGDLSCTIESFTPLRYRES